MRVIHSSRIRKSFFHKAVIATMFLFPVLLINGCATVSTSVERVSSNKTALNLITSSLPGGAVGAPYGTTFQASGGTLPYNWKITRGAVPNGLALSGDGTMSGIATSLGTFQFTVLVASANSTVAAASKSFSIVITAASASLPLTILTSSLPSGALNAKYSQTLAAEGGRAPYAWSITSGALPAGLSLASSLGQINGTPSQSGTFPLAMTVQDSSSTAQKVTKTLSIAIAPSVTTTIPLAIVTSSLVSGTVNGNYVQSLAASGGKTPYTWSISSGTLPSGLSLVPLLGQINGTPSQSGTFPLSVTVQDSSSTAQKVTKTLSIAIATSVTTPTPLAIVTSSLVSGTVNGNYTQTLAATGGKAPYSWAISAGALPLGLSLVGPLAQINGTPTQAGTSSVTVVVQDASSPALIASRIYSIVVGSSSGGSVGSGTPITSCQILATTGGTYSLQNDVSSVTSCFDVQANDVTINLNGHTVTYSNSVTPPNYAVFGIYGAAVWDPNFISGGIATGNPTGGSWNNLTVAGPGTITQGNCLDPSNINIGSNAIHLGQGGGDGLSVFQVTFNICADSTQAIYSDANGSGLSVHDNIVNNKVVTARKRSTFQGVSFLCDGCANDNAAASNFYNNQITGGPQGCIMWNNPNTNLYNNTCSHGNPGAILVTPSSSLVCYSNQYTNALGTLPANAGTQCTNDFGLYARTVGGSVFGNTVTPLEGRGIFVGSGSGVLVHDNVVNSAIELPNNSEYNGCEIAGAYGLQLDDNGLGETVYNNSITATSRLCTASALRITDSESYSNISYNNTYMATRAAGALTCGGFINGSTGCAYAISMDGTSGTKPLQFTSRNDSFTADSALMFFDWDGPSNETLFLSPTFKKGNNADPNFFYFAIFRNGHGTVNVHIRDAVFGSGVNPTNVLLPAQSPNNQSASLYIDWTLTLTVENAAGNPINGATVKYADALSSSECNVTTDAIGTATCLLTQYRINNDSGANQVELRNPFTLNISAPGCTTLTDTESISGTTSEIKRLSGC
jgi:hypothetical protein